MLIDYEIRFSSKRKTLGIVVERDGRIVVLAPEGLAPSHIAEIVQKKQQWILSKLHDSAKYPIEPMEKEFVSGESILYLGKECQLVVIDDKWLSLIHISEPTRPY